MGYSAVQIFYCTVPCSSFAFGTVFFLSKHYTNSQIGIVLAAASILSVVVQPAAASLADSSAHVSMKQLMLILTAAGGALAALRFFFSDFAVASAVLFILEQTVVSAMQPLFNSLGVQAMNRGADVNFGLSRGLGSAAYAGVSVALGFLLKNMRSDVLPLFSVIFYAAFAVAVVKFPADRHAAVPEKETAFLEGKKQNSGNTAAGSGLFRKENRRFFLLLTAVVFSFCTEIMIANFLIQIMDRVGGTAENVGIANGIAAAIEVPSMALFGALIRKFSSGTLLRFSFIAFVLKAVATMLAPSVPVLYAVQILQFGAYALFVPASVYYANEIVPEKDLAKGQAALTSASTFGGVIASLLGGWLLDCAGVGVMLGICALISASGCVMGLLAVKKGKSAKMPTSRE